MEKPRNPVLPQYPPRAPQSGSPPGGTPARPPQQSPVPRPPPPAGARLEYSSAAASPHRILAAAAICDGLFRLAQQSLNAKQVFGDQSHSTFATIAQTLIALALLSAVLSFVGGLLLLAPKRVAIKLILVGSASAILIQLSDPVFFVIGKSMQQGFRFDGSVIRPFLLWARVSLAPAIIFVLMLRSDVRHAIKWRL